MRTAPFLCAFLAVLLVASSPAIADERRDYIEECLDKWIEHAEDLGYEIIEADIDTMRSSRSYRFELWPGTYHAYAEGDRRIDDLNMAAYGRQCRELDSDYMADNFPVLTFTIRERQEVEIELTASGDRNDSRGYFCFVLAREPARHDRWTGRFGDHWRRWSQSRDEDYWNDWGEEYRDEWDDWNEWDDSCDWEFSWDPYWECWGDEWCYEDEDWSHGERRRYVETQLDYLREYARDRHMRPIMDDVARIDDEKTYTIMLTRGRYVLFAGAGPWIEDLDLHVLDDEGWTIADDIQLDDAPAVWFDLSHPTRVEIEVEVWGFKGFHDEDFFCVLLCRD